MAPLEGRGGREWDRQGEWVRVLIGLGFAALTLGHGLAGRAIG